MVALSNLVPLLKKRKTIGRGGSRGGTSGKGHKGQKARSGGGVRQVFEGGQMPLTRRLPKHGFNNANFKKEFVIINLGTLENLFDAGEIINRESLLAKRVIKASAKLLKVLGSGKLSKKFTLHVDAISQSAKDLIISNGGEVHLKKES